MSTKHDVWVLSHYILDDSYLCSYYFLSLYHKLQDLPQSVPVSGLENSHLCQLGTSHMQVW